MPFSAYELAIRHDGSWMMKAGNKTLVSGMIQSSPGQWHNVLLSFQGNKIYAAIDGKKIAELTDVSIQKGCVALGSGWNRVFFDNLLIEKNN